jgi:hypothetical protein
MNQHTIHPDLARLTEIESRFIALSNWISTAQLLRGTRAPYLVAGEKIILSFGSGAADDDRIFYHNAPADVGFLLEFAARAIRHARGSAQPQRHSKPSKPSRDFAAECAMKCAEPSFRAYLTEKHKLPADPTDDDVKVCVREALGISSRSKLNTDPDAADRWFKMRAAFQLWERHG